MSNIRQYYWKGINRFQQRQSGKILAPNRMWLEQYLIQKGFQHIKIKQNFVFPFPPEKEEITQLFQQIALLVNTAIPLQQSLVLLQENCLNVQLYRWLQCIIEQIECGFSFATALEKESKYLTLQEIQLIKMGEMSGNLNEILIHLVQSRETTDKLVKKVKKILFYPILILIITISFSILLLIFIVPQFAELYGDKNKTLPWITSSLFSLSQWLQQNWMLFIILVLLFIKILFLLRNKAIVQSIKFYLINYVPVFNQIVHYSRIIYFCQSCYLMLDAHIRLDRILQSFIAEKLNDPILKNEIKFCLQVLKQGYRFADGLNPKVFGQEVVSLISIGEKSGNLSPILMKITQIYQQKLDYKIDILSKLLEPILMLVIGFIVGIILIGIYLPIFDLGSVV